MFAPKSVSKVSRKPLPASPAPAVAPTNAPAGPPKAKPARPPARPPATKPRLASSHIAAFSSATLRKNA